MSQIQVTASVVIYKTENNLISQLVQSLKACVLDRIVIIDNSPSDFPVYEDWPHNYVYHKSNKNIGFGAGHNLAFSLLNKKSDFHLIINPDIFFIGDLVSPMVKEFIIDDQIGILSPLICYPDGRVQPSTRLIPTPLDFFIRRFFPMSNFRRWLLRNYEMLSLDISKSQEVPIISGCFFMIRSDIFRSIAGFDERFFLYNEDYDLVRRAGSVSKVIFDPKFLVFHYYQRESAKSLKLFVIHSFSTIQYFNKWGWFIDMNRTIINSAFDKKLNLK